MDSEIRQKLVAQVAVSNDVSETLLNSLLELEDEFANIHAWGMRPALRRRIVGLVDDALNASGITDT